MAAAAAAAATSGAAAAAAAAATTATASAAAAVMHWLYWCLRGLHFVHSGGWAYIFPSRQSCSVCL